MNKVTNKQLVHPVTAELRLRFQQPIENHLTEKQAHEVKEWVAHVQQESLLALTNRGHATGSNAQLITARSDSIGYTSMMEIDGKELSDYFALLSDVGRLLVGYEWPSEEKAPLVKCDLRCFVITGATDLSIRHLHLDLRHVTFKGKLSIRPQGRNLIETGQTHFLETEINLGLMGSLLLTGEGSTSVNGRFSVTDQPRSGDSFSLTGRGFDFNEEVHFDNCTFGDLSVKDIVFRREVAFERCRISNLKLPKVVFHGRVSFKATQFADNAPLFLNALFYEPAEFSYCLFVSPPDFHGATLHQNTRFTACDFVVAGDTFSPTCAPSDIASYRVLKNHFSKQKDSRQEGVFYAFEQRAERQLTRGDPAEFVISFLQDVVSGYGTSITRAMGWFFAWNFGFAVGFELAHTQTQAINVKLGASSIFVEAPGVALALQNAFNPLALFSEKSLVESSSWWFYGFSLFQALGSIGIVALVLLTIRAKFRKGSASES